MLKMRMLKWFAPPLCQLMGPELTHWVPTLISTGVNIVAVVGAWYLQQVRLRLRARLRVRPAAGSPCLVGLGLRLRVGAWYLQQAARVRARLRDKLNPNPTPHQVVSAFYSALRGGKLCASTLLPYLPHISPIPGAQGLPALRPARHRQDAARARRLQQHRRRLP